MNEALAYLGLEQPSNPQRQTRTANLASVRRLVEESRLIHNVVKHIRTEEDAERCASLYHRRSDIEGMIEILSDGTEKQKNWLFEGTDGKPTT